MLVYLDAARVFGRLASGVSENVAGIWVGQVFAHYIG